MSAPRKEILAEGIEIWLGDCRDVLPLIGRVDAVVTDPPYGVGIKYGDAYDDRRTDYWDWLREIIDIMRNTAGLVVFTHRVAALKEINTADWVGVRNKPGAFGARVGNSCILPHWEPIFLYGIHAAGVQSNYTPYVITFNPEPAKAGIKGIGREKWGIAFASHPCPKPLGLYQYFIHTFAQNAKLIVDPFMGSGTTGVACVNLGRKFIGIELEPKYFDIARRRITEALQQPDIFIEKPKPVVQESLL